MESLHRRSDRFDGAFSDVLLHLAGDFLEPPSPGRVSSPARAIVPLALIGAGLNPSKDLQSLPAVAERRMRMPIGLNLANDTDRLPYCPDSLFSACLSAGRPPQLFRSFRQDPLGHYRRHPLV